MYLMITPEEAQEGSIANFDADHLLHLFTAPTAELALSIHLCWPNYQPITTTKKGHSNPILLIHRSLPREFDRLLVSYSIIYFSAFLPKLLHYVSSGYKVTL